MRDKPIAKYVKRKKIAKNKLRIKGKFITKEQAIAMFGPNYNQKFKDKLTKL